MKIYRRVDEGFVKEYQFLVGKNRMFLNIEISNSPDDDPAIVVNFGFSKITPIFFGLSLIWKELNIVFFDTKYN